MNPSDALVVAIDGPSASGKSTVARGVAAAMDFIYVDSGSLYRGVTWRMLENGVDVHEPDAVVQVLAGLHWELFLVEGAVRFRIDGEDPGEAIRNEPVRESVSFIARIPEVRTLIVEQLRSMRSLGSLVVEGRDIGTVVFPDSPCKFYLDADPEERARRRHEEIARVEGTSDVQQVLDSLQRRDQIDSTRETAPLQIAEGAHVINSTGVGVEEVVALIVQAVKQGCA